MKSILNSKLVISGLVLASTVTLSGCGSLSNAGLAEYSIKPMMIDKQTVCCEVVIKNGKEYAALKAKIIKTGDNYSVELDETGVAAFKGQEIVGSAVGSTVTSASSVANKAIMTSTASGLGTALIPKVQEGLDQ